MDETHLMDTESEHPAHPSRLRIILSWIGAFFLLVILLLAIYGGLRFFDDQPVTFESDLDHFKYGSTGGERGWKKQFGFGIPYWIWIAQPELFPEYLPDQKTGQGYAAFGMLYEDGKDPRFDLPIGMSMRRVTGIDRVYFNCALCHTGSVRDEPGGPRNIVPGMPANTFDLGALVGFLETVSKDWRYRPGRMMPKIEQLAELRDSDYQGDNDYLPEAWGLIDRQVFNLVGVSMMGDELRGLLGRIGFMQHDTWGPGRVDTFNAPKALLGFRMDKATDRELLGNADFPSVWNQGPRKGMWLHWDGNNCSVDERNLSAGFGTGATPATIDRDSVFRIADWLWEEAQPPPFPADKINPQLASQGEAIYRRYCRNCHGDREPPFRKPGDGSSLGTVVPIDEIGTDRARLDSYTPELAQAQNSIYAGYPLAGDEACQEYFDTVCSAGQPVAQYRKLREQCYPARFMHFRKTRGYVNMPLDGLWLRAPYLHNGSVPNLRQLLEPGPGRARQFYIGYDVYDYDNVGFVSSGPEARQQGWLLDTSLTGNGNRGHEGAAYGTELDADQKQALLEYLKTF